LKQNSKIYTLQEIKQTVFFLFGNFPFNLRTREIQNQISTSLFSEGKNRISILISLCKSKI